MKTAKPRDFGVELRTVKERYLLLDSDLAFLLGVFYGNIYHWLGGKSPRPNRLPILLDRLDRIKTIEKFLPIPFEVTQYQRKQYLTDALNGKLTPVLKSCTATKGI